MRQRRRFGHTRAFRASKAVFENTDKGCGGSVGSNQPISDSLSGSVSCGSPEKSRVT
ncbi:hypothetical protein [Brevundimonas sp. TSRC1-1]|uniref:hypothetical protein n=1 Tax=Brevundimonas sp. TSRC1-1 TaxID=2804562 RepID=UPI003CEA8386